MSKQEGNGEVARNKVVVNNKWLKGMFGYVIGKSQQSTSF